MRASITSDAPRSGFAPADVPRFDAEATEGFERVPGTFAPESAIDEQIGELERWALANVARDRQGKLRFWVLRGVAFIGAVGAAVGAGFGYPKVALALSVCSALAVAIDAAWPSGSFRSPHQRAVHDLRELQNTLKLRWDKVRLAHPDPQARERIAHALTLLDESGLLLAAPLALQQALRAQDWTRLFVTERALWREARALVVGHALLEKLLAPRKPLCARVLFVSDLQAPALPADLTPAALPPLPVLGIPGWWPANDAAGFYADDRVFRPKRLASAPAQGGLAC